MREIEVRPPGPGAVPGGAAITRESILAKVEQHHEEIRAPRGPRWWVAVLGLAAAALAAGACGGAGNEDWPEFRGPLGTGVSDAENLPTVWKEGSSNIRWKATLSGVGNSTPVASAGQVYLTYAFRDEAAGEPAGPKAQRWRAVQAFDLESGEELWSTRIVKAPSEKKHRLNTLAAPSPVLEGDSVFVYFGSVLARLDRQGTVIWQKEIDPTYAKFTRYGAASSPVLTQKAVIIFQDQEYARTEDIGWLAAFDRETGEQLWRQEWKNSCCGYSTPLVVDRGSGEEVIVGHTVRVTSYDAGTGEILWNHDYPMRQVVSSPMLDGDLLGVSGGAHNIRGTVFLRLAGSGAETSKEVLWEDTRFAPHTSSPVLYRGLMFAVTDPGIMSCFDAETGELKWKDRLPLARNRASLVAGDGKIYVSSTLGRIFVVAADGTGFRLLSDNGLEEPGSNASPAVAGGCLLVRTHAYLYCIEGGEEIPAPAGSST